MGQLCLFLAVMYFAALVTEVACQRPTGTELGDDWFLLVSQMNLRIGTMDEELHTCKAMALGSQQDRLDLALMGEKLDRLHDKFDQFDLAALDKKLDQLNADVHALKTYMVENVHTPEIHNYSVHYSLKSWPEARADCQDQGMDLASINSMAEREYVVGRITQACSAQSYWVAARKTNDVWIWANDGTALDPQLWADQQPEENGNFVNLWGTRRFALDNTFGTQRLCYICESTGK